MREVCFVTGCDSNTEWQLPWFIDNYAKHVNKDIPLAVADFGMSNEMQQKIANDPRVYGVFSCKPEGTRGGWFGKLKAMLSIKPNTSKDGICWLDTDCEIVSDPSGIFKYIEDNKLAMVEDKPWTKRRPGMGRWHNTGVVAFKGSPPILREWLRISQEKTDIVGDQEVLHWMLGGDEMRKLQFITDLPHRYNVLRIDYIDGCVPKNPVIVHHTGQKGNETIRMKMNV